MLCGSWLLYSGKIDIMTNSVSDLSKTRSLNKKLSLKLRVLVLLKKLLLMVRSPL